MINKFNNIYLLLRKPFKKKIPIFHNELIDDAEITSDVIKEYGLLVDINKVDKVANALIKYLVDKKFYNKIRIGAFNYVLKNYNYITISKKYLSIFNKIKN